MPYRCFSCENDDTVETALPVGTEAWPDKNGQENVETAGQYCCSFCNGIMLTGEARWRHRTGWVKKPSAITEVK